MPRGLNEDEFRLPRWALGDSDDSDGSPGRILFGPMLPPLEISSSSPTIDEFAYAPGNTSNTFGSGNQRGFNTPLTSPSVNPPPFTLATSTSSSSATHERISPFLYHQTQTSQIHPPMMGSPQLTVGPQAGQHFPRTTSLPLLSEPLRQPLPSISMMHQPQQSPQAGSISSSSRHSPPLYLPLSLNDVHADSSTISAYHNSPPFVVGQPHSPQQLYNPFGPLNSNVTSTTPPLQPFGANSTKKFPSFTPPFSPQPPVYNPVQIQPPQQYPEDTQRTLGQVSRQSSQPLLIFNRGRSQQPQTVGRQNNYYPRTQSFSRLHPRGVSDTPSATSSAHGSGTGTPISPYSQPTTPTVTYSMNSIGVVGGRKSNSRPLSHSGSRYSSPQGSPIASPSAPSIYTPPISISAAYPNPSSSKNMVAIRHRRALLEVAAALFPGQCLTQCFKPLSSTEWTKYLSEREKVLSQRIPPGN